MIEYKDFTPALLKKGFFGNKYGTLRDCLAEANGWIDSEGIQVINVETVVLPNMWDEEGCEDPDIRTSGEMMSTWHQFVRVWYSRDGS